jgi:hypothetical protein
METGFVDGVDVLQTLEVNETVFFCVYSELGWRGRYSDLGTGLEDRSSNPSRERGFTPLLDVHTAAGIHPASY